MYHGLSFDKLQESCNKPLKYDFYENDCTIENIFSILKKNLHCKMTLEEC